MTAILGIETSCDETGIAIYQHDALQGHSQQNNSQQKKGSVVADLLFSQVDLHRAYGGVVPELASRDHIRRTLPMIDQAIQESGLTKDDISAIAYTRGPGLVGALLVGASVAKSLAFAWNIPAIGIHHMEGHLVSAQLTNEAPAYPFVALLVSGGHTQLMACPSPHHYQLLGESQDDAAGEAFDKVAKMLGLNYPGGPEIARLAESGTPDRFKFPRPMTNRPGLDFSFSGLKTYTMNTIDDVVKAVQPASSSGQAQLGTDLPEQDKADIAYAFQEAVVDTIRIKCQRALEKTGFSRLIIAGGVSANSRLRETLDQLAQKKNYEINYPPLKLCTDNGAMIAYAGYLRLQASQQEGLSIDVRPRWPMTELNDAEAVG